MAVERHGGHHARALDAAHRVGRRLVGRHGEAEEEVVARGEVVEGVIDAGPVAAGDVEEGGVELAGKEQGGGRVAAVQLVSHVQRPRHDGLQRHAPEGAHGRRQHGGDVLLEEAELPLDVGVVGPVVEALSRLALVEVAEGPVAEGAVLHDEDGHGGGVDAGHRADAAVVLAGLEAESRRRRASPGLHLVGGEALEDGRAGDGPALAAPVGLPVEAGAGGEDEVVGHAGHDLACREDVDEHGVGGAHAGHRLLVGLLAGAAGGAHQASTPPSTRSTVPAM